MTPPLVYHAADGDLVRRVLMETRVSTTPAGPAITGYLGAWMNAGVRWVTTFLSARPSLGRGLGLAAGIIAVLTVALAVALVLVQLLRGFRGRASRAGSAVRLDWTEAPGRTFPTADRLAWKGEIERRLGLGDIAGALVALWWFLATSLSLGTDIDSSWTTRELLLKASRRDLLGLGRRLDALMYGPKGPSPGEITGCLASFEESLA